MHDQPAFAIRKTCGPPSVRSAVLFQQPLLDLRQGVLVRDLQFVSRLERGRDVVRGVGAAHRTGNGTPTALLAATAAYLGFDLDLREVAHDDERWWHLAPATDRLVASGIDRTPRGWDKASDHTPVWCELEEVS